MTNIPGATLNNKFDDIVKINDKDVKANVKKLDKNTTFEEAQKYLEKNKDGYDTVGVIADGEKYLVSVIHDGSIEKIQLGNSVTEMNFVENEVNTPGEVSLVKKIAASAGGVTVGAVATTGTIMGLASSTNVVWKLWNAPLPKTRVGCLMVLTLAAAAFLALPAKGGVVGYKMVTSVPKQDEIPTDKLSNGTAVTGAIVVDKAILSKFKFSIKR